MINNPGKYATRAVVKLVVRSHATFHYNNYLFYERHPFVTYKCIQCDICVILNAGDVIFCDTIVDVQRSFEFSTSYWRLPLTSLSRKYSGSFQYAYTIQFYIEVLYLEEAVRILNSSLVLQIFKTSILFSTVLDWSSNSSNWCRLFENCPWVYRACANRQCW